MRTPYVNVIFVFPQGFNEITFAKTFPYPNDMTPSKLADEIADWIRSLND